MPNVNVMHEPSIPQTVNGVVIDGSTGGGVSPAPGTSQQLSYFSLNAPASPFAGSIFQDATLKTALVAVVWFIPAGCSFIVYDGPLGNPGISTIMWGLNGDTAPGFGSILVNAKIKVGPNCWLLASGQTSDLTFFATYTGAQQ